MLNNKHVQFARWAKQDKSSQADGSKAYVTFTAKQNDQIIYSSLLMTVSTVQLN